MGGLGPGIGGSEWFIIGLVALLVVGPERLPGLLRQLGKLVAKARGMANEFRSSFDEMARQSELDELRKEVEALRTGQGALGAPVRLGAEADAAFKDIRDELNKPLVGAEPAMTPAASEWPDGEPVLMPVSPPPLTEPETVPALDAAPKPARKPRKPAAAVALAAAPKAAAAKPAAKAAATKTSTAKAAATPVSKPRAPRKPKTTS